MENCIKSFVLVFVFALLSINGMGQSKPQRDVAKDRKSAVLKPQKSSVSNKIQVSASKKRTVVKRQMAYSNKRRRIYNRSQQIKNNEPNLTVSSTNIVFEAKEYTKSVGVNANGKSWYLSEVPNWCRVAYYTDFFTITCNNNTSENGKDAAFYVHSGDQSIRISVHQSGAPTAQASIYNVTLQHNVKVGNEKYLVISGTIDVSVSYERSFFIGAIFYDTQNRLVNANFTYPSYKFSDTDYLFLSKTFVAKKTERYNYFSMYLPNNSMSLVRGKNFLTCKLNVYNSSDGTVVSSNEYIVRFHAKNRKGNIETGE